MRRVSVAAALVFAALVLGGCGANGESMTEPGAPLGIPGFGWFLLIGAAILGISAALMAWARR